MRTTSQESVHSIERELTVLLRRVRRVVAENARLLHCDLQPAAYAVFLYVVEHAPTRAADIAEELGVDKSAVSRSVVHLEELELVERSCDPSDRRAQSLLLTEVGRSRIAEVAARRRAEFDSRLSAWSSPDLAQFAEQLHRYNASLDV